MARRTATVASLERRAKALKLYQTNLAIRQKADPKIGSQGDRPRIAVKYKSANTGENYTVSSSSTAVAFFTLGALGLESSDASPIPPRGFRPNFVMATKAKNTGVVKVADLSKTPYLSYAETNTKTTQSSYRAPLVADTPAEIKTKLAAIYTAQKAALGIHGTLRFEAEKYPLSFG